jgi:cellulose biosynthesis protein BcsQ
MLMLAAEQEVAESAVNHLLREGAGLATLERAKTHLVPKLNRVWLVPASFSLAELENTLLLKWLIDEEGALDVRYRLAKVLLDPDVRRSYGAIILDTPPRMTIGTVSALVASHHFLVPTTLDKLSVEAVPNFINNIKVIKVDLDLDIELAGIVGTMTRQSNLGQREIAAQEIAREAGYQWKADEDYVLPHIPRLTAIADAAGMDIAYFGTDSQGNPLKERFDPIFEGVCRRIGLTSS